MKVGMNMKKAFYVIPIIFICIWIGSIIHCSILTSEHGAEFSSTEVIGFGYMHPWEGTPQLRVIMYSSTKAMVYYYAETGGELVEFQKENDGWFYKKTHSIWSSTGGSADNYFIWPYYKNWVP